MVQNLSSEAIAADFSGRAVFTFQTFVYYELSYKIFT
jgi:hypothetical protein